MDTQTRDAMQALIDAGTHPRGCRSKHVDKRRKDADEFGFGPCDCGWDAAVKQATELLNKPIICA